MNPLHHLKERWAAEQPLHHDSQSKNVRCIKVKVVVVQFAASLLTPAGAGLSTSGVSVLRHMLLGLLFLCSANGCLAEELPCLLENCFAEQTCPHHEGQGCDMGATQNHAHGAITSTAKFSLSGLLLVLAYVAFFVLGGQPGFLAAAGPVYGRGRLDWLIATWRFRERLALPARAP